MDRAPKLETFAKPKVRGGAHTALASKGITTTMERKKLEAIRDD